MEAEQNQSQQQHQHQHQLEQYPQLQLQLQPQPQPQRANVLRAKADDVRRTQQQRLQRPPRSWRDGYPSTRYFDILLIQDDDYYFLGEDDKAPFWATPKPPYFDDFEAACRESNVASLQHLTSQNALTPAVLHHGLTLALAAGSVASARQLLLCGAPIVKRTPEVILSAPQDKQIPLLNVLAAQGWKPSYELFMQVICNIDLLKWCLSHGTNPNYGIKRDTPTRSGGPSYECANALEAAASKGNAEAIEILIEAGAKIAYGVPLHRAAGATPPGFYPPDYPPWQTQDFDTSRIPAMEVLLKHGADIDQHDNSPHETPRYPILFALDVGAVQRARWLLDHGADPDLKGPFGSAVEMVARERSDEMKKVFQQRSRAQ